MKTDPTSMISGAANMPLSHEAIQTNRNSAQSIRKSRGSSDAISDTLETSDREPDGHVLRHNPQESVAPGTGQIGVPAPETTGDQLDLQG